MLKGESISFTYPCGKTILNNVSIAIELGQIVGLTAASGRGKSTLAKVLAGHEKPTEGQVLFEGCRLPSKGFNPVQLIYQHPERAVNPLLKLEQIIKEGGEAEEELFGALEIDKKWLYRYPTELSGGELQRLCILRAIKAPTKILIADEMTAMLDPITQLKIWQVLLSVAKERNIGVLVISHNKYLLNKISDKLIELDKINGQEAKDGIT